MKRNRPAHIALAIAALGVELSLDKVPVDIRLIPAGEFRSSDGSGRPVSCAAWVCTDADGGRLVADASARASKRVIDYEHATLHAKQAGSRAPAAGWFKDLEWRPGDGLYAIGVEWTSQAAQDIASLAYRFISPVFSYDPVSGRVDKLLHAALTNDPGLDGLTDLASLAAEYLLPPINPTETTMDLLKQLLAVLGLQEATTEAEALSAVAALKTNVAALSAQVTAPDPSKFAPIATLTALQGENSGLQTQVAALTAQLNDGKLDKVIEDGKAAGKITPATEAWAREHGKKDLASLSAWIQVAPVVVKPGETQSGGKGNGEGVAALTAEQTQVCELLGVSPAEFQKTLAA
jgi:phage I-like protein